jgi:hypothetical protein
MTICSCCKDEHDLDFDRIAEIPSTQGFYDNGWQWVSIWCCTHDRFESHWVDFDLIPERFRRTLPGYVPQIQQDEEAAAAQLLNEFLDRRACG